MTKMRKCSLIRLRNVMKYKMHLFPARYDMRKALTMDVEKKSVIPLPAPVSMLSWMMVAWMAVLILALVLQSLYPPVSITHNIADAA